jgi:hypothetical protein
MIWLTKRNTSNAWICNDYMLKTYTKINGLMVCHQYFNIFSCRSRNSPLVYYIQMYINFKTLLLWHRIVEYLLLADNFSLTQIKWHAKTSVLEYILNIYLPWIEITLCNNPCNVNHYKTLGWISTTERVVLEEV